MEIISYERRDYQSVDDRSLSYISKDNGKQNSCNKGLTHGKPLSRQGIFWEGEGRLQYIPMTVLLNSSRRQLFLL